MKLLVLLLLWICVARVSAGIGGAINPTGHVQRYLQRSSRTNNSAPDIDEATTLNNNNTTQVLLQVKETTGTNPISTGMPHVVMLVHSVYNYCRGLMEQVIWDRGIPPIDLGGDTTAAEILLGVCCHPSRLLRSFLLSWVATEIWRKCGFFYQRGRQRRRPKRQRKDNGKRYRRSTQTRKTYKTEIKGVVETPVDEDYFQQGYTKPRKGARPHVGKQSDVFSGLVPESQEKGDFLSKKQKEGLLKDFEVTRRGSHHKPKTAKKWLFGLKPPKLTRKKKFRAAWAMGYIVSPFLQTPVGGALAGWMGVVCVTANLIPWADKKFKLDILEDNELLEGLLEYFRDNELLNALLFGSLVGACQSNNTMETSTLGNSHS